MSGHIYFVTYPSLLWVKIGYATSVQKRLTQLRVSCPGDIQLAASVPGTRADEKALHKALTCSERSREWFRLDIVSHEVVEKARAGAPISEIITFAKRLDTWRRDNFDALHEAISSKYKTPTGGARLIAEIEEQLA